MTASQTLSTSLEADARTADLHFQDEALLSAALPKDFHPSLLQVGSQGEGLQGGVPRGATRTRPGASKHLKKAILNLQCLSLLLMTGTAFHNSFSA